jgi:hypothetical protein
MLGGVIVLLLGAGSTPRDAQGRLLLLLPEMRSVQDYQRTAQGWARDLEFLDGDLAGLLQANSADILADSGQAQQELERSAMIAQAIEGRDPPPALAGLADELRQTAQAYQEAAVAAAQAVSVPDGAHMKSAQDALGKARQELGVLERNPWLTSEP